jgi:hypothetical protein
MSKKISFTVRLEPEQVEKIRSIAIEGNVSLWLRQLINRELEKLQK